MKNLAQPLHASNQIILPPPSPFPEPERGFFYSSPGYRPRKFVIITDDPLKTFHHSFDPRSPLLYILHQQIALNIAALSSSRRCWLFPNLDTCLDSVWTKLLFNGHCDSFPALLRRARMKFLPAFPLGCLRTMKCSGKMVEGQNDLFFLSR